jgi:phytol kinase
MFIGGWVLSGSIIVIYVQQGIFAQPFTIYLIPITLISLVATIVEALPFRHVDNLTVTIASVLVGVVIF